MHPGLQIIEIVRAILWWLENDKQALTALALTCQKFNDPASDLLWHLLPSLAPLVRCLPGHLLEERVEERRERSSSEQAEQQMLTMLVST
jgi:hypothetical protein